MKCMSVAIVLLSLLFYVKNKWDKYLCVLYENVVLFLHSLEE